MKTQELLNKTDKAIVIILKYLTITLFILLTIILTANIIGRLLPFFSLQWLDEIVELLFAAMVFYGAAAVWISKGHFSAGNWIEKRIKNARLTVLYKLMIEACAFAFIAIFFKYSLDLTMRAGDVTSVFQIPKKVLYSCMPASAAIMCVYSLFRIGAFVVQLFSPAEKR
ncbi:MAG: TRAP transporter small permease [Spirochaetes bacterium]|nr:TRAP transporter small permease [Spirochaetota bacterium]